ncbi:MAG: CDP-glycerol glycerophosphotransferase family protein, partial [Lachnospiraceae bacterium]|nr:CDP-glycerol glycerophosphotransferase family protein [Lachnospiraceae bacterium]
NTENICLDTRKEYLDNFASADILVSDMSGVVVDFAVTGKPVIFCSYKEIFNDANKKLMDAYYVVHNVQELKDTLEMLCRGEDPKSSMRQEIVRELLGNCNGGNGQKILEYIKQDHYGRLK